MDILGTLNQLIKTALATGPGSPPLPTVLEQVGGRLDELLGVAIDPSGDGLERWLTALRSITGDEEVRETLLVRVLQVHLPRVAEALAFAGVLTVRWAAPARPRSFGVDWGALDRFTKDPRNQLVNTLLTRAPSVKDVQAVQGLLLLLLGAPRELVAREYEGKGFLSLPVGDGVSLDDLVGLVNSPLALPLGQPLVDRLTSGESIVGWLQQLKAGGAFPIPPPRLTVGSPDPPRTPPLEGLELAVEADASLLNGARVSLPGGWLLNAEALGTGVVTARVRITGDHLDTGAAGRGTARVRVFVSRSRDDDALLLGNPSGTFFSVRDVRVGAVFSPDPAEPPLSYTVLLSDVRLGAGLDLLKPLAMGLPLPGSLTFEADVNLADGLAVGLDIPKHLGFTIGGPGLGLWLDDMVVRVEVAVANRRLAFRVLFRFDARAEVGPLKASMSGAGAWVGRWSSGNAGVIEPTGIGLSLEAGPVSGGGFFGKLGPGEYGGSLSLKILGIGAFAYGVYKELPDGAASFVAVIGLRLPPPGIQVGFGFAISGFGGLIGINRRADTDRLRDTLVSGTAGDVLFTDDPTKNSPRILGELRTLFPDQKGTHVFGPTMQLNWLHLIKLDLGVFIELPGPRRIFIAGSGRLVVGSEDFALVYFRLDFIGGIDLTASLLFFDGALVNSHILGVIRITGGVAFRLGFGAAPYFMFSIGGFHPAFTPGGVAVPQVPRAGAGVDLGLVWFTQQTYFAVTSNTVQFGARTEAGVRIGPIQVHGWFGFDALVQFKPFRFVAAIDAGMAATFEGIEFASIRVRGELTGPGPLVLRASASVKVLIRVSKSVTITLDNRPPESLPAIANVAEHLRDEIERKNNLRGEGSDPEVVLGADPGGATAILPVGSLVWEQRRVPLDRTLQKVEGQPLEPARSLTVECRDRSGGLLSVAPEDDLFAVGTYANISDAEALSGPTFSSGRSGFRLAVSARYARALTEEPHAQTTDIVRLPHRRPLGTGRALTRIQPGVLDGLLQRSDGAAVVARVPDVAVREEKWRVVDGGPQHAADAFLTARAQGTVAMPVSTPAVGLAGVL